MPTAVAPDALGPLVEALAAQSGLVGARVYDRIPASPTWPLIVCSVVSDGEATPEWLQARVQVDIWGRANDPSAHVEVLALAKRLRAVVRDLPGTWTAGRLLYAGYLNGLDRPDATTGRHRFMVDLMIYTHS
jgi:hypothetical protein